VAAVAVASVIDEEDEDAEAEEDPGNDGPAYL